jgi:hypothetical protein
MVCEGVEEPYLIGARIREDVFRARGLDLRHKQIASSPVAVVGLEALTGVSWLAAMTARAPVALNPVATSRSKKARRERPPAR